MNWRLVVPVGVAFVAVVGFFYWQRISVTPEVEPAPVAKPVPKKEPSPTLSRMGLTILETTTPQADEWLVAHGLECTTVGPTKRGLMLRECYGIPEGLFAGRTSDAGAALTLSFASDGKLQKVQVVSTYDDVSEAIAAYQAALPPITESFGPPTAQVGQETPENVLQKRMARVSSTWRYEDLNAGLVLMRATHASIRLVESWGAVEPARER